MNIHCKDWCWSWSSNAWSSDSKSLLTGKDPDAGKDWRQKEKGETEDEMVELHHWVNKHELAQTPCPFPCPQRVRHDMATEQQSCLSSLSGYEGHRPILILWTAQQSWIQTSKENGWRRDRPLALSSISSTHQSPMPLLMPCTPRKQCNWCVHQSPCCTQGFFCLVSFHFYF